MFSYLLFYYGDEVTMNSISLKAYAKINLGLDVLGTLPDGYHEVKNGNAEHKPV